MDFGQLPIHRGFDPSLAPLDVLGVKRLSGVTTAEPFLFIGAPQWNAPGWKGRFYPKNTSSEKFLEEYVKIWNSIEFNSSFYRNPDPEQLEKWMKRVQANTNQEFRFFVKAFQGLSHEPLFWADPKSMDKKISQFIDAWIPLGKMWQGTFLQLPPEFSLHDLAKLKVWLSLWPRELALDIEFRHPTWFQNRHLHPAAYELLQEHGVAALLTDTAGRRDVSHGSLTADRLMIRFLAQSSEDEPEPATNDLDRLDLWAKRVAGLFSRGLKQCSFFLHTPEEHWAPDLAREFASRFDEHAKEFKISVPYRVPKPIEESQLGFQFE